jgi:hypothetical protein
LKHAVIVVEIADESTGLHFPRKVLGESTLKFQTDIQ